jgi:hypothetical protein
MHWKTPTPCMNFCAGPENKKNDTPKKDWLIAVIHG